MLGNTFGKLFTGISSFGESHHSSLMLALVSIFLGCSSIFKQKVKN